VAKGVNGSYLSTKDSRRSDKQTSVGERQNQVTSDDGCECYVGGQVCTELVLPRCDAPPVPAAGEDPFDQMALAVGFLVERMPGFVYWIVGNDVIRASLDEVAAQIIAVVDSAARQHRPSGKALIWATAARTSPSRQSSLRVSWVGRNSRQ
jgi:hypothetical protein